MVRNFRAARVADVVNRNIRSEYRKGDWPAVPSWLKAVEMIPPAEVHTRQIPIAYQTPDPRMRKPRRTYRPQKIVYEEDELRQTFFRDHPWELARPRVILETDGKDTRRYDWSKGLVQDGIPLSGECVVQRQMFLMHTTGMSKEHAYDKVRREFYTLRHHEEVEQRVAQEEARMVGAYFGPSALDIGMRREDGIYENWKRWAEKQNKAAEAIRNKAYVSFGTGEEDGDQAPAAEL